MAKNAGRAQGGGTVTRMIQLVRKKGRQGRCLFGGAWLETVPCLKPSAGALVLLVGQGEEGEHEGNRGAWFGDTYDRVTDERDQEARGTLQPTFYCYHQ